MNPTYQKFNWTRLIIAIGFVCAALDFCGVVFAFIAATRHLHEEAIDSPVWVIVWFGTLICGVGLLKRQKKTGLILISIWIVSLILGSLIPAT
jgi:hypothetical protein